MMQDRKSILMALFKGREDVAERLVEEMLFLERKMDECRKLPFLQVYPDGRQTATPASKLYRECMSQYTPLVKLLVSLSGNKGEEKTSPLREYAKMLAERG